MIPNRDVQVAAGRASVVRIKTIYPKRRSGGFWSTLFGGGVSEKMSVAYEVSVLRKMDLHTTNGRVEVGEPVR